AAAERDGHPVGAALALELFEVERQRKRRGGIAQGSRPRLRERHQFIHCLHLERGVDNQRLRVEEQIDDRLEILGRIEGKLLVEELIIREARWFQRMQGLWAFFE